MRLYSFVIGNYLNRLQCGIQTGHCAVDLARSGNHMAEAWADNHKTFIILDAGNMSGLKKIANDLESLINTYNTLSVNNIPYTSFYEDMESLDGIMTCFACILPETVYNKTRDFTREAAKAHLEEYQYALDNMYTMIHSPDSYATLIAATMKPYQLVSV